MNTKAQAQVEKLQANQNEKLNNLLNDLADVHDLIGNELYHLPQQSSMATQAIANARQVLKNLKK